MANRKAIAPHDFKSLGDAPMVPVTIRICKEDADIIKAISSDRRQEILRQIIANGLRDWVANAAR